jgi:hypothetical protein
MKKTPGANLSLDQRRDAVQAALSKKSSSTRSTAPCSPSCRWVSDIYLDRVVFNDGNGKLFEANYEIGEDGKATFTSDAKEVRRSFEDVPKGATISKSSI